MQACNISEYRFLRSRNSIELIKIHLEGILGQCFKMADFFAIWHIQPKQRNLAQHYIETCYYQNNLLEIKCPIKSNEIHFRSSWTLFFQNGGFNYYMIDKSSEFTLTLHTDVQYIKIYVSRTRNLIQRIKITSDDIL